MGAIITAIATLLSALPGKIGDYFSKKQELEQLKLETEQKIELERQKLAAQIAEAEQQRANTVLSSTGAYFKYFTFIMWFGPFMIGIFSPELSKRIFDNLSLMPEWYVQSCMIIMFTVWGISISSPLIANVFQGLQSFFSERRQFKIDKLNAKAVFDKKAFFDAMRVVKGSLSQADVDQGNKVLDQLEKEGSNNG